MSELVFTPERRAELRAFLSDDQLLQSEYPRVAEYFNAAAGLPGTGDSDADMAFDVRFLHFMTGGQVVSENPYWEIVAPSVFARDGRRVVDGGNPQGSPQLAFAEMILQASYAYAIPSPETIQWVMRHCADRPIVELGAGRGYWAAQLSRAGLDVRGYELEPPDAIDNASFPRATGQTDVWFPVAGLPSMEAEGLSNSTLFLCWPPGWGNPMASDALKAYEASGGDRLIYVGELKGGKTGDDAFFDALAERWELESTDSQFVSWWNLADVAQIWVRR
ncbi:hypothetical protein [Catenulispora rubra]|uniref:hypothetical protein n=1 Tax=Catenulispora rubra TaxID=280293 RepID=UPI0018925279|nr:hypothetical protein [Catenulispora rubra]